MDSTLERLMKDVDCQDGTDREAEDLTRAEWAKVTSADKPKYGDPVCIVFVQDEGFEDCEPVMDSGYLTCVPDRDGDWDMVGIVHIPRPWVEKESPIPEWHSLCSLCKNPLVKAIVIGAIPGWAKE